MPGRRWLFWIEALPVAAHRPWFGYGVAILASWSAVWVRWLTGLPLGTSFPFITFVPAVVLTAFFLGVRPGALAGILSWFLARYYFMDPRLSFTLTREAGVGIIFYGLMIAIDLAIIHLMQSANRSLSAQREEAARQTAMRELMFRELQHRVSNKLQIVASLLTLQKRQVADRDAQKALDEAARRVGMIGRISRALYDPDHRGLGVEAFLDQVGRDIIEAAGASAVTLDIAVEPGIAFTDDSGVPIALIIAETISNALEHGFASSGQGTIAIRVTRAPEGGLMVTVRDDGVGIAPEFDVSAASSLGLRIATTLAQQLGGSFALRAAGDRGAIAELRVAG